MISSALVPSFLQLGKRKGERDCRDCAPLLRRERRRRAFESRRRTTPAAGRHSSTNRASEIRNTQA